MRRDDAAVAGFFEDLPVLVFVLAGVASIVITGTFATEQRREQREQIELDEMAESLADSLMSRLRLDVAPDVLLPTLNAMLGIDISQIASDVPEGFGCGICLVRLHPDYEWLSGTISSDVLPMVTGYAVRLTNVLDGSGLTSIVEVRVLVWQVR